MYTKQFEEADMFQAFKDLGKSLLVLIKLDSIKGDYRHTLVSARKICFHCGDELLTKTVVAETQSIHYALNYREYCDSLQFLNDLGIPLTAQDEHFCDRCNHVHSNDAMVFLEVNESGFKNPPYFHYFEALNPEFFNVLKLHFPREVKKKDVRDPQGYQLITWKMDLPVDPETLQLQPEECCWYRVYLRTKSGRQVVLQQKSKGTIIRESVNSVAYHFFEWDSAPYAFLNLASCDVFLNQIGLKNYLIYISEKQEGRLLDETSAQRIYKYEFYRKKHPFIETLSKAGYLAVVNLLLEKGNTRGYQDELFHVEGQTIPELFGYSETVFNYLQDAGVFHHQLAVFEAYQLNRLKPFTLAFLESFDKVVTLHDFLKAYEVIQTLIRRGHSREALVEDAKAIYKQSRVQPIDYWNCLNYLSSRVSV